MIAGLVGYVLEILALECPLTLWLMTGPLRERFVVMMDALVTLDIWCIWCVCLVKTSAGPAVGVLAALHAADAGATF